MIYQRPTNALLTAFPTPSQRAANGYQRATNGLAPHPPYPLSVQAALGGPLNQDQKSGAMGALHVNAFIGLFPVGARRPSSAWEAPHRTCFGSGSSTSVTLRNLDAPTALIAAAPRGTRRIGPEIGVYYLIKDIDEPNRSPS